MQLQWQTLRHPSINFQRNTVYTSDSVDGMLNKLHGLVLNHEFLVFKKTGQTLKREWVSLVVDQGLRIKRGPWRAKREPNKEGQKGTKQRKEKKANQLIKTFSQLCALK